jgi:hypothetical protein
MNKAGVVRTLTRVAATVGGALALLAPSASRALAETFSAGGRSYVVETDTLAANAPAGQIFAVCPTGERALGGGSSNTGAFEDLWLLGSQPAQSSGSSGYHKWLAVYQGFGNTSPITIRGYAICDEQKPQVVEKSFVAGQTGLTTEQANCPGDRHVVGGGGEIYLNNGYLLASRPIDRGDADSKPDDGWEVTFDNLQPEDLDADVYALCAKTKPTYRSATNPSIAVGQQNSAKASCPTSGKKKYLVGGGHSTPAPTITARINASNPFIDVVGQAPSRSWITYLDVRFGAPTSLTAYAVCAKKA